MVLRQRGAMNSPSSALPKTHANTIDPIANGAHDDLPAEAEPTDALDAPSAACTKPTRVAVLFPSCLLDRDGKRLG